MDIEVEESQFNQKKTDMIGDDQNSTGLTDDIKCKEFSEYAQYQLDDHINFIQGFEIEQLESDVEDLYKKILDEPMNAEEIEVIKKLDTLSLKESKKQNFEKANYIGGKK